TRSGLPGRRPSSLHPALWMKRPPSHLSAIFPAMIAPGSSGRLLEKRMHFVRPAHGIGAAQLDKCLRVAPLKEQIRDQGGPCPAPGPRRYTENVKEGTCRPGYLPVVGHGQFIKRSARCDGQRADRAQRLAF